MPAQIDILMDLRGESKPSTWLRKLGNILDSFLDDMRISPLQADIRRQMIDDGENPDEEVSGLVASLRNWEQHRVAMELATIGLMRILAREPEAALRAL